MRRTFIAAGVVAGLLSAIPGQAQPQAPAPPAAGDNRAATRTAILKEMVSAGVEAVNRNVPGGRPFQTTFGPGGRGLVTSYLISVLSEREGYKALLTLMEARMDKQVGSTSSSSGSTSVAAKGLVPDILGVAVESGALDKEVKGTTLTFRAKPMGIIKALQGRGLIDTYTDYSISPAARFAARFSAATSFDTTRGPTPGTFTGDEQQLTTWSARAEVINGRNPAAPQYAELWTALGKNSEAYKKSAAAINDVLGKWPEFTKWESDLIAEVEKDVDMVWTMDKDTGAAAARFKTILEAALPKLEKLPNRPDPVTKALDGYVVELTSVQKSIDKIYAFAGKGLLVTFDWTTVRDKNVPDLYVATGIFQIALGAARKTDLTLNGAIKFYKEQPLNATRAFKSFDLTGQLEHPLGSGFFLPSATAAISGRYSYLPNDTVATGSQGGAAATAPKGSIYLIQAKLTVPIKGSGVKVPLSVTASNRTELIKEKDVRASFGFTFDLDTFFTALSAKAN